MLLGPAETLTRISPLPSGTMPEMRSTSELLFATCFVLTGSVTIVSGPNATVALRSEPAGANVTVRNHEGAVVAQTVTPAEVSLKRSRKWAKPASYTARFEMPGYASTETPIETHVNPWVIGNIVLGGPIGLVADAASGAMYRPKQSEVALALTPAPAYNAPDRVQVANGVESPPTFR